MPINARKLREKRIEAAQGYLMLDMPEHALKELSAVGDPEKCPFVWNQLRGEALRQQREFVDALKAYERALAEAPTDRHVVMGMAWCYKRTGQLHKAIAAMQELYRTSPDEPIVLYNLACYFALDGDKQQALSWLGRSLRLDAALHKLIGDESDFDGLRDDADFQLIVNTIDDVSTTS